MTNVYVCEISLKSNYDKYEKYLNKFICVSKAVECTYDECCFIVYGIFVRGLLNVTQEGLLLKLAQYDPLPDFSKFSE